MSTVQDKPQVPQVKEKDLSNLEDHKNIATQDDKFIRFDDPTPLTEDHHDHDDGAPSMAEKILMVNVVVWPLIALCLLYTSPSPRDRTRSRMPSSA